MDSLKENMAKVKEYLMDLANLFKEGKDRNDVKVKDMEHKICTALDIPRESWMNTSQSLKDVIENLHKHLDIVQNSTISSEMIPDKDVLKNASGGLALEGVYKTRNPEDMLETREQIIEIPDSFSLTFPKQPTICEQREFSSHQSEITFHKVMEKLGYSFSSSLNIAFKGCNLGYRVKRGKKREIGDTSSNSQEESYILHTKYNYIPLACGVFQKDKLRLSSGALNALNEVEMISLYEDGKPQTNKVRCFFERFGSHVTQGPLHFGGIFWWRVSASGFKSDDRSEVKHLTCKSLNAYCGGGLGFGELPISGKAATATSFRDVRGSLIGQHREDLISQVQLSVSKTGGPAEIDDYLLWKSHLAVNNRTWSIIDKGTTLIPVWEIITTSHRDDFRDVSNLSRILMDAYKDITGEDVEEVWGDSTRAYVEKAEILIQSVEPWSATDCENHLTKLLDFKNSLFKKTGSYRIWHLECLSNEILQNYLLKVANESTAMNLRFLMRFLLESDLDEVKNFHNRSQILNWAYQSEDDSNEHISVSDFSELDRILQCAKREVEDSRYTFSSSEEEHSAKMKATITVNLSLNSVCKTLGDSDQEEVKLLILSIITVMGYSRENKTFNLLLGKNEIGFLQSELHNSFTHYSSLREQCPIRAQAYLLLTALTASMDKDITISPRQKGERLQLIQAELKDKLSNKIKSIIEDIQNDWESLESELHSIIEGRQKETGSRKIRNEEAACQLKNLQVKRMAPLPELSKTDEHNSPAYDIDEKGKSFMDLLQKLDLKDSYPKKMTRASVLVIDSLSLNVTEPKTEKDLSSHYLYKLITLDYKARYLFVKPETINTGSKGDIVNEADDFFDCDVQSNLVVSSEHTHIHPMDVHMAIFHCSSDFLRQYIYTKLSACQFSLPLLVPNPCTDEVELPLWALRQIRKSWHSKTQAAHDTSGKYHNGQMFNTPVPIVSFIRLGVSDSNSKSQILNDVINKQKHPVFFNRHCKGSTPNSLLMNGVVEIAWYCPGGKKDDIFDDCVAFLNLHGDAQEHPKQLEFLQAVSSVIVLLLSEHSLSPKAKDISQKLAKSPVPLICLFSGKDIVQQSNNPMKVRLAAKNRNQAEFSEELVSSIKQCISEHNKTASIEICCKEAKKQQFKVDEDKPSNEEGRAKAQTLMAVLKDLSVKDNMGDNLPTLKEAILPLQGKLWHDWCAKNKERYRLQIKEENESIEDHRSQISSDMTIIREMQLQKATPLNDFVRSFLEYLTTPAELEDTHMYMLQWLRILMDDLTSHELASLEKDYHSTWRHMKNIPKGKDKASFVNPLQKKLDDIANKMAANTVGIQHIMREVSQLYEALHIPGKASINNECATLSKIGVIMLISGYPLEIMDGDAAHIPSVWIKAVLDELIKTLGDKKVFVLSILGLQSSGKSTLLNTMFGLQFATSAGRCTHGAFMQLLEVDSSIRNDLGYDFVLIVDTEGLRSPELSTKISNNHDNELATFIIGIGDVTVINIMGENPSEMHDILQICVQAFLRMKQVKFTASCIFVHQNVAESSAGDKNIDGRRRLLEKLDEMTQMAAKVENVDGITCFSDVIHFDIETQVFYFKHLLEGDPPMAPINPSYSQNVQELKTKLLQLKKWQNKSKCSSLSEFKGRMSDLWSALLQENFVFSFRNTVEMMAYSSLEHKFGVWSWELRKHSLSSQTKLENQIGSNIIQDMTLPILTDEFDKVYNPLKTEMENYFTEDKDKDILINWKANIDRRFSSLRSELIEGIWKKYNELKTAKQNRKELDQKIAKYMTQLTEQSKYLASTLETQHVTDEKMREEFDKLWIKWTTDVTNSQPPEKSRIVKADIENALLNEFKNQSNMVEKVKNVKFQFDPYTHIQQSVMAKKLGRSSSDHSMTRLLEKAFHSVNEYIKAKENERKDFDINFIYEILNNISKIVDEFESTPENPTFSKELRVDLSVYICLKDVSKLQKMHDEFRTANQPLAYLQSQRETFFQSFKNYCKGANSLTIFVDFLCKTITPEVLNAANNNTCQQIADRLKTSNPALKDNRSNLENHILKDLAILQDICRYNMYIDQPKRYFKKFLQEKVNEFCSNTGNLQVIHEEHLKSLKNQILVESTAVTREVSDKHGNARLWLDLFCKKMGEHIIIKRDELRSIDNEDITDWQFFKETMARSLEEMIKDKNIDVNTMRERPAIILYQQLQGCWAQCPFCRAICTNTIPYHDGDHSVQFHRSKALSGCAYDNTGQFCIEFCTTSVVSNQHFIPHYGGKSIPYKQYRKAGDPYDKWNITAAGSSQGYWKWFLCHFKSQWEKKYNSSFTGNGKIPSQWHKIKKESILKELK